MIYSLEDLSNDQLINEKWDDILYDTTDIVLTKLLGKKAEKVDVTILIDDDCLEEGCDAYCVETDKNTFEVSLGTHLWDYPKKRIVKEVVTTLAHELVHVAQFASGMMKNPHHTKTIYEKKTYINADVEYHDRPWEVEAFALQDNLAEMVMEKLNG